MISRDELRERLIAGGIPSHVIQIFDLDYELPKPRWIQNELAGAFRRFLFDAELVGRPEQFDCNKYAKLASTMADLCWARTRKSDAALAFGLAGVGLHMVNVAVHKDGVAFYEPQLQGEGVSGGVSMRRVEHTREDLRLCTVCLFV